MKKTRLPHVVCGLRRIQPRKESGSNVTEEQSDAVAERGKEIRKIHSWRFAQEGADVGLQRRHVRGHAVAWQYQMETETACDSGRAVGVVWQKHADSGV